MSRSTLRVHFIHRHVRDTVVILEEGVHPVPRCPKCDILFTWRALNFNPHATEMCSRGDERRQNRQWEEEARRRNVVAFQDYGRPLVSVSEFNYLGRMLTALDDNWPAVVGNLIKVWNRWARMSRILGQEGADPQTSGNFYNALVQYTRLFGADSWLISLHIGRTLGGIHHRVACSLENIQIRRTGEGMYIYPPLDAIMKSVGVEEV